MRRVVPALAVAIVAAPHAAVAQGATLPPGPAYQAPPAPQPQKALPDIRIERRGSVSDTGPSGPAVVIGTLHVTGATRFPEVVLVGVAGFEPGKALTIADLRRMAARISNYYNAHGYIVAQAYVPAQVIADGAVTITVIEGRYGAVDLKNRSRLHDGVARGILSGLQTGDVIDSTPLERRLLLLSDVPGVHVASTLEPGAAVGTSDLQADLTNAHLVSGEVDVDNDGDPLTGRYRGGGTLNLNDPFGLGDLASVRFLTSGSGFYYVKGSYQAQLGVVTLGGAYQAFEYELGRQFASLNLQGSERIASIYASYPLIRTYDDTLRVLGDFDYRVLHDNEDTPGAEDDRRAEVGTVGLTGNHHDHLGGGGWDAYTLSLSAGDLNIQSPLALAADATTARSEGGYAVLRGGIDRLQNIGGPFQVYGWVRGQVASKNLDISEQMELGGAYAVRAYPEGEAYGDEGYLATVELRMWLPKPWERMPGRLQLAAFEDVGFVRFAVNPWLTGPDTATRSGAGAGLTWAQDNNFLVRVSYAHRVGTPPATSFPDTGGEFRFEAMKFF